MKATIIKSTVADFKRVEAGQVVDLSPETYRLLIQLKKAIPYVKLPTRKRTIKKAKKCLEKM